MRRAARPAQAKAFNNKAAPVTQGGLFVSTYIAGKATRYLARPSS